MKKSLLKFIKYFLFFVGIIFFFLFFLFFGIELSVPYYSYTEPKPFHGNKIYNPYEKNYQIKWLKTNFHAHSNRWKNITPASHNTPEEIYSVYKKLSYDFIEISDYQNINKYNNSLESYIPEYEHGFNVKKNHQVLIGAKNVLWFDYPFFQTINHKQFIIDLLKKENTLVTIAHPDIRSAYTINDIKFLCNYDLIEVLNRASESSQLWDTLLSNGKPKFLLADDDVHDVNQIGLISRCCTFVGAEDLKNENIINALKTGCSIGADISDESNDNLNDRAKKLKEISLPKSIKIINDTLIIEMLDSIKEAAFIGQNGKRHNSELVYSKIAKCKIQDEDTYIRTVIYEKNGIRLFLNPIYKYQDLPITKEDYKIDILKTSLLWFISALIYFTLIFFFIKTAKFIKRKIH